MENTRKRRFINEEDLTEESFAEFCREIDSIIAKASRERQRLDESATPRFNSIEEANRYYNAIPFQEWENKIFKEYGIDDSPK